MLFTHISERAIHLLTKILLYFKTHLQMCPARIGKLFANTVIVGAIHELPK